MLARISICDAHSVQVGLVDFIPGGRSVVVVNTGIWTAILIARYPATHLGVCLSACSVLDRVTAGNIYTSAAESERVLIIESPRVGAGLVRVCHVQEGNSPPSRAST